jgi:tetratricopeptide (TPR) repeat protein
MWLLAQPFSLWYFASLMARWYPALLGGLLLIFGACSMFKSAPTVRPPLSAVACKPLTVVQNNQAGMALYNERRFEDAKTKFMEAVSTGPNCAEAHYNLGLSLSYLGAKAEAHQHFLEAANLAPGNQVIWDSPALHPYGEPQKEKKTTKAATEQAPGTFGNRGRMGGY